MNLREKFLKKAHEYVTKAEKEEETIFTKNIAEEEKEDKMEEKKEEKVEEKKEDSSPEMKAQEDMPGPVVEDLIEEEKPMEDVKEEVEDKKEDVEEKVEEVEEEAEQKLSKIMDLLEKNNELLAKLLATEEMEQEKATEEAFEELKEDQKSEDADVSSEEFGVDPNALIVGKKEDSPSANLTEEFSEDEALKNTYKQVNPPVQITKVKEDEVPDMLKLSSVVMEITDSKDKWLIKDAANEEVPLYEIASDNSDNFATEDFAVSFVSFAKENGLNEALKKFNATKIEAKKDMDRSKLLKMNIPDQDDMFKVKKEAENNYKRKHAEAQKLVWAAMNKNLIDNPLKATLLDNLLEIGVDASKATDVIESAFASAAEQFFTNTASKTDEYLSLTPEAFMETYRIISSMNINKPNVKSYVNDKAEELRERAIKGSVIINSQTHDPDFDRQSLVTKALPKPANYIRAKKVK